MLLTTTVVSNEIISKENLFDFLHSKQYLKTNFTQTTLMDLNERVVSGNIQASRSGNFKIEYHDPIKEIISADKEFLYKLDTELEQLDIVPREEYFKNTPISILISNIENLKKLGCDYIEFSVNQRVRKIINRHAFFSVGDIQWPEHLLIFTIPVRAAVQFKIPVIIWGESSTREYGAGRPEDAKLSLIHISEPTRPY